MRILAFDTTGPTCSVAAWHEGFATASHCRTLGRGHAEALLPMIEAVRDEAGWRWADIDLLAVCHGPGSFTGLRVGVAAARGLAMAAGMPVLAISALEGLAAAAGIGTLPILAVIDARRAQVFAQRFTAQTEPENEPVALDPAAPELALPACRIVGSGAAPVIELQAAGSDMHHIDVVLDASVIAARAELLVANGSARLPGIAVEPVYLRLPDARPQPRNTLLAAGI